MKLPIVGARNTVTQIAIYIVPFVIFTILPIIFCSQSYPADDVAEYVIGLGDVVQVSVWQHEQFDTTATVGPDGKIAIYLTGDVQIAGFTREKAKEHIAERLTKYIKEDIEVTINVAQFNSQRIYVFGQVTNPKSIAFFAAPSLVEAVMIQCVPTPDADLSAVKIIPSTPSSREPVTVDLVEYLKQGKSSGLPKLHPGDTIYVPKIKTEAAESGIQDVVDTTESTSTQESTTQTQTPPVGTQGRPFIVHVMGLVRTPDTHIFDKEPTLTEVLLKAGSVEDSMTLRYVRIVRSDPKMEEKVVDVDLDEYLRMGDASRIPKLYSGDIVYVPDITQEKVKDISIIVTGQVLAPGTYRSSGQINILDAISLAGGLTPEADTENIRIRRETADSYEEKVVNIDEYLSEIGNTAPPDMVEPGYRIYVPMKRETFSLASGAIRGVIAFLVDVAVIYSMWRVVGD